MKRGPKRFTEAERAARFWARVDIAEDAEVCWLWTGPQMGWGYGSVSWWFAGRKVTIGAHQIAFWLTHGWRPSERGLVTRHRCHTPLCCNPAHLRAGTAAENSADMVGAGRGRGKISRGEAHGRARLTEVAVREILIHLRAGRPIKALAREYGVHRVVIRRIDRGTGWSHIDPDAPDGKTRLPISRSEGGS